MVHRNGVQEKDIPPAGLISFVQKGIQYLELETNLNEVRLWHLSSMSAHVLTGLR